MALVLENIFKKFNGQTAVENVSLTIQEGEFFALLGPSGCGKTTLLRMISGFETPTSGRILLDGKDITNLPTQERPFNMVFQSYALFPHLTVEENLAFGLKIKKVPTEQINENVTEMLKLINMESFRNRLPETLSGGQSQRVAVARALINKPKILLLDEPLSALDKKMRDHMQTELRSLQKRLGVTFIFVTHDQDEAMSMADQIAVMEKGHLRQVSAPHEMYNNPQDPFTASFLGDMNLFQDDGQKVFVRPERTHITLEKPADTRIVFEGEVANKMFKGIFWDIYVRLDNQRIVKCLVDSKNEDFIQDLSHGKRVFMSYSLDQAHVFESVK